MVLIIFILLQYVADRSFIGCKLDMKPYVHHIDGKMGTKQLPIHVYGRE